MAITCSFCGTEIKENETACSLCGTAVENTSAPVVEDAPAPVVEEVKPELAAEAESIVAAEEVKGETDAAPVWICTQCGKEFDSATKFCGECGGKVTEKKPVEEIVPVWICTKCGKEFDTATKFCGECGGKVAEKNAASAEEFDNNSAEAAKWYKKAGISATSEKLSVEKGESCSISEPVFGDAEKYRTILADLHDGSMYYVTSFDEKKLNAAMEFYGKELVRNEQDILIHRDLSIFGKTAGYILTEYGIAYTKSKGLFKGWEPRVILFDKNTEMIVHDKEREGFDYWYVTLNGEEVLDCFDQSCGKVDPKDELIADVLQMLVEKNKQNSDSGKAGNIVEQYRNKLQQLHDGDYYFVSSFDEKRLTSAMKTYGCNLVKSEKDIIVWHDSSSRCTGKEGFILTNYGFVWHRDGYEETYLFDKSTRFTINEDDDGIYFGFNLRRGELGCWCFEKQNGKISRNENLLLDTISEIVDSYKN